MTHVQRSVPSPPPPQASPSYAYSVVLQEQDDEPHPSTSMMPLSVPISASRRPLCLATLTFCISFPYILLGLVLLATAYRPELFISLPPRSSSAVSASKSQQQPEMDGLPTLAVATTDKMSIFAPPPEKLIDGISVADDSDSHESVEAASFLSSASNCPACPVCPFFSSTTPPSPRPLFADITQSVPTPSPEKIAPIVEPLSAPPTIDKPPPTQPPSTCNSPFVHDYEHIWTADIYNDWLQYIPAPNAPPDASPTYPYNADYKLHVDAPYESDGQLSVSQIQVVILSAGIFLRSRDDAVMASWGHQIPPNHIYMYTDSEDPLKRLPIIAFSHTPGLPIPNDTSHANSKYYSLEGGDGFTGYQRGMIRWLQGMQHAFPLVMDNPSIRWLLFADDDTYVFWPHLLRIAAEYNSTEKVSLGKVYASGRGAEHLYGGAGWLISRGVVSVMVERVQECYGYYWRNTALNIFYDVEIVQCFMAILDISTISRIEMEDAPVITYTYGQRGRGEIYKVYDRKNGLVKAATFHYTQGEHMVALHNVAWTMGIN